MNIRTLILFFIFGLGLIACDPARRSSSTPRPTPLKPNSSKPAPMDTIRWSQNNHGRPPISGTPASTETGKPPAPGETYHIAFLLPFLSNQMRGSEVPEKSRLGVQFYAGAKIALEQLSTEQNFNLVAHIWDTQGNDADFQKLMQNPALEKNSVFVGPVRNSHLNLFAPWAQKNRKILISPESPSANITQQNPDFIQINPSLRAHCYAILQFIRQKHRSDAITLVAKAREADRLPYFQDANQAIAGGSTLSELIVPDESTNFDKIDLKKYLRAGRTTVFVLPTWSSQDYVMAFLRRLKEQKGSNRVEVYGMPQWRGYETIDPEYLSSLNVHISVASWLDYTTPEIKDFQQKFYAATGTIPDEDGFNGYDVTLFTGRMLGRYGLSFPQHLDETEIKTLRGSMQFNKIYANSRVDDALNKPDYWENTFVHILKFEKFGFLPAE